MADLNSAPILNRQQTANSDWSAEEKGIHKHVEDVHVPDTITEEDEGGNVGLAAYNKSKEMGEIVSRARLDVRPVLMRSDARDQPTDSQTDRRFPPASLPHHPDPPVPRQDGAQLRQGLWDGKGYAHEWEPVLSRRRHLLHVSASLWPNRGGTADAL
jgi:hypothetical protein